MNDAENFLEAALDARLKRITTSQVPADLRQELLDEMHEEFRQAATRHSSLEEAKREFLEKFDLGNWRYSARG